MAARVLALQLETELEQERHMADSLVGAMQPELRERFHDLKSANVGYSQLHAHAAYLFAEARIVAG